MALISRSFLGKNCDGGVRAAMDQKLTIAQNLLQATYAGQLTLGQFSGTFEEWSGMRQTHGAAHLGGQHTLGDALDINYDTNPYIATRTPTPAGGVIYGGEAPAPAGIQMARVRATAVYDRAVAFLSTSSTVANVSARAATEGTPAVYQRFLTVSNALKQYLQFVFLATLPSTLTNPPHLNRAPVANAQSADLPILLAGIPQSERLPDATARANIAARLGNPSFALSHLGWDLTVDFWYRQILRDYEAVRIPMVFGATSVSPGQTRNPANGFLTLREEIVTTLAGDPPIVLVNPWMRWGVCDFGAQESGDVQHFDLAPRIPSGAPGDSPPEVRISLQTTAGVQQALASLGFDAGAVNNIETPETKAAVQSFRTSHLLGPGGVDLAFRLALGAALTAAAIPFSAN